MIKLATKGMRFKRIDSSLRSTTTRSLRSQIHWRNNHLRWIPILHTTSFLEELTSSETADPSSFTCPAGCSHSGSSASATNSQCLWEWGSWGSPISTKGPSFKGDHSSELWWQRNHHLHGIPLHYLLPWRMIIHEDSSSQFTCLSGCSHSGLFEPTTDSKSQSPVEWDSLRVEIHSE